MEPADTGKYKRGDLVGGRVEGRWRLTAGAQCQNRGRRLGGTSAAAKVGKWLISLSAAAEDSPPSSTPHRRRRSIGSTRRPRHCVGFTSGSLKFKMAALEGREVELERARERDERTLFNIRSDPQQRGVNWNSLLSPCGPNKVATCQGSAKLGTRRILKMDTRTKCESPLQF